MHARGSVPIVMGLRLAAQLRYYFTQNNHYATDRAHNEPLGLFSMFWPSARVQ